MVNVVKPKTKERTGQGATTVPPKKQPKRSLVALEQLQTPTAQVGESVDRNVLVGRRKPFVGRKMHPDGVFHKLCRTDSKCVKLNKKMLLLNKTKTELFELYVGQKTNNPHPLKYDRGSIIIWAFLHIAIIFFGFVQMNPSILSSTLHLCTNQCNFDVVVGKKWKNFKQYEYFEVPMNFQWCYLSAI